MDNDSKSVSDHATLSANIIYMQRDIGEIKDAIKSLPTLYVILDAFKPVQNICYGLVGILGLATITAMLKLVLKI